MDNRFAKVAQLIVKHLCAKILRNQCYFSQEKIFFNNFYMILSSKMFFSKITKISQKMINLYLNFLLFWHKIVSKSNINA